MTNHLASEPTDGGGRVVITRFDCRNRRTILLFLLVHSRIKRDVRQECPGFIAASRVIIWSDRTLLSITLWRDLDSIYDMGGVPRHIFASRLPWGGSVSRRYEKRGRSFLVRGAHMLAPGRLSAAPNQKIPLLIRSHRRVETAGAHRPAYTNVSPIHHLRRPRVGSRRIGENHDSVR